MGTDARGQAGSGSRRPKFAQATAPAIGYWPLTQPARAAEIRLVRSLPAETALVWTALFVPVRVAFGEGLRLLSPLAAGR